MGILRLAHVDVRTPDLDLSTAYYTEVMGLQQVARTEDTVYLKCWDEEDHHSLRMRYNPRTGLDSFTFRVEQEDDLAEFEKKVEAYGCPTSRVSRGGAVGQGESIRSRCRPARSWSWSGTSRRPATSWASATPRPSRRPTCRASRRRAWTTCWSTPRRSPRPRASSSTCSACGSPSRCSTATVTSSACGSGNTHSPHDIAIVNGPNGALHHWAYWLDDWDHVRKAADTLAYNGVQIDQGPTRHGVTRGNTIYFFDPLGIRNEVFTGGYWVDPDTEILTWTEDNFGKGLFYYENVISQRFLRMHT